MRSKLLIIALCSSVAACNTPDLPSKGIAAVNVPVVTSADYVFDAAAPGGTLAPGEAERLNAWLAGLGVGYGDSVYVDGPFTEVARGQVAAIIGQYGLLMSEGAPVTTGMVPPNSVRVVVSRRSAYMPNCPNWRVPSQPNYDNATMSNFGCGVNGNLAMQVANPTDLVRGREGAAAVDATTASKAILMYRDWPLTGVTSGQSLRPLNEANTKKDDK